MMPLYPHLTVLGNKEEDPIKQEIHPNILHTFVAKEEVLGRKLN